MHFYMKQSYMHADHRYMQWRVSVGKTRHGQYCLLMCREEKNPPLYGFPRIPRFEESRCQIFFIRCIISPVSRHRRFFLADFQNPNPIQTSTLCRLWTLPERSLYYGSQLLGKVSDIPVLILGVYNCCEIFEILYFSLGSKKIISVKKI